MRKYAFLLFILLLSLVLRLHKLGFNDLWYDEALTAHIATGDTLLTGDVQPPLYTIITAVLCSIFKKSEFLFRFPAMIFGFLSVLGIYQLTSILFNKYAGLISAFLLCFSPMNIWYSQEARANTLAAFFAIYIIYFFVLLVKNKSGLLLWSIFILSTILGLYSSYFIVLLLIPELIILVLEKKQNLIFKWIICWGISLLFFLPWVLTVMQHNAGALIEGNFWINKPHLSSLINTWDIFNLGYNSYNFYYLIGRAITFLLICVCLIQNRGRIKSVSAIFSLFFIPILTTFLISQWRSIYLVRKMMIFLPFYLSMVGYGIFLFKKKGIQLFLILSFVVLYIPSITNYYKDYIPTSIATSIGYMGTYVKKPFKPVVDYIKKNLKKGDIIGFSTMSVNCSILYYWNGEGVFYYFYLPSVQDIYTLKKVIEPQKSWNDTVVDLSKEFLSPFPSRIWVISSSWDRGDELDPESLAVKEWFEQRYPKIREQEFDGIVVSLFDTKQKLN